jgi:hypothetical protein
MAEVLSSHPAAAHAAPAADPLPPGHRDERFELLLDIFVDGLARRR